MYWKVRKESKEDVHCPPESGSPLVKTSDLTLMYLYRQLLYTVMKREDFGSLFNKTKPRIYN